MAKSSHVAGVQRARATALLAVPIVGICAIFGLGLAHCGPTPDREFLSWYIGEMATEVEILGCDRELGPDIFLGEQTNRCEFRVDTHQRREELDRVFDAFPVDIVRPHDDPGCASAGTGYSYIEVCIVEDRVRITEYFPPD